MPWTCACGVEVEQDEPQCPSCAAPKTSWTMVREQTRKFVLTTKRFEVLRGADKAPAEVAPVMAKDLARVTPLDPEALLHVRLHAKGQQDPRVSMALEFEQAEVTPAEFPAFEEVNAEGFVDVPFLLVNGPGGVEGIAVEGAHVLDATEETERGFAPAVEVKALGKPAKTLPLEPFTGWYLSARFFDQTGQRSVVGKALKVLGREATTDAEGRVVIEQVPPMDLEVAFDDRKVVVPAVHDPRVVVGVWLRFVEPGELPVATPDAQLEDHEGLHPGATVIGAGELVAAEETMRACVDLHEEADWYLSARFFDRTGLRAVAGRALTVAGREVTTDGEGRVVVDGMPNDELEVGFDDRTVIVPAVHDPRVVVAVRLRFVEPGALPYATPDLELEDAEGLYPTAGGEEGEEDEEDEASERDSAHGSEGPVLSARFVDRLGTAPVTNATFTVDGQEAQTDEDGFALVHGVPDDLLTVTFEDGEARVPAVYDDRQVVLVRLRFVDPAEVADDEEEDDDDVEDDDDLDDLYPVGDAAVEDDVEPLEEEEPPAYGHDGPARAALLSARFVDGTGRFPVADTSFRAAGREGRTDATGLATLRDLDGAEVEVEVGDHVVRVPTVEDERRIVLARLRLREATEAERARPIRLEEDGAVETYVGGEPGADDGGDAPVEPDEAPEMHGES